MAGKVDISQFLRRCRDRIDPESVGLPERGAYRRVPGLRREEVAQLAGASTDYCTRLEQGRNITLQRARPGLLRFLESFHDHAAFILGRPLPARDLQSRPPRHEGQTAPPALSDNVLAQDTCTR